MPGSASESSRSFYESGIESDGRTHHPEYLAFVTLKEKNEPRTSPPPQGLLRGFGPCNDHQVRHEAKASHYESEHKGQLKGLIDALFTLHEGRTTRRTHLARLD